MTGQEYDKLFQQNYDVAYSDFYDATRRNRLYRQAFISAIEGKYRETDEQREYDELASVIRTNQVFPVTANNLRTAPLQISNMSPVGTTITVTTVLTHNLSVGDTVTIDQVAGLTTTPVLNGSSFTVVTVTSATTFTFTVTAFAGTYTANTGLVTAANLVSDYLHLLAIKAKFSQSLRATVTAATNATPIVITASSRTNIRTGERITISGVTGNTAANGTFYVRQITATKFSLYTDKALASPVAGNGAYVSGGALSRIVYEYCQPWYSDRKVSTYSTPTINLPRYERADSYLKIYPDDEVCTEVTIDYLSDAVIFPDITDTVTDLSLYYTDQFLYHTINIAVSLISGNVRDAERLQLSMAEQQQNP